MNSLRNESRVSQMNKQGYITKISLLPDGTVLENNPGGRCLDKDEEFSIEDLLQ